MLIVYLPLQWVESLTGYEEASACAPEDVRTYRTRYFKVGGYFGP
jgi:hypothetical protein